MSGKRGLLRINRGGRGSRNRNNERHLRPVVTQEQASPYRYDHRHPICPTYTRGRDQGESAYAGNLFRAVSVDLAGVNNDGGIGRNCLLAQIKKSLDYLGKVVGEPETGEQPSAEQNLLKRLKEKYQQEIERQ